MTVLLLLITSIIYATVAVRYTIDKQYGLALAFFCYAIANLGFILAGESK